MARRTVVSQVTSPVESALGQVAASPLTRLVLESAAQLKERAEKLVGDLLDVDGRVKALEKRVEALEKAGRASARSRSGTAKKTPAKTSSPTSAGESSSLSP